MPSIMIVEDESVLLEAIKTKFETKGVSAITCTSAEQALDYLKSLPELPNCIWLDYYLESMNGLEFVQKLHENQDWKEIPIVVVSNSASHEKVKNLLGLGVKKYLLKANHRLEDLVDTTCEFINTEAKEQTNE